MTYYKPSSELSATERNKRNKKNNETLRKWRQRKREEMNKLKNAKAENEGFEASASGYESVSSSLNNTLQVRMNFQTERRMHLGYELAGPFRRHTGILNH